MTVKKNYLHEHNQHTQKSIFLSYQPGYIILHQRDVMFAAVSSIIIIINYLRFCHRIGMINYYLNIPTTYLNHI